ncbi:hypothetical protein ATY78_06625 [Rhizobium sp. R635]|uniref:hypothetical protein n=1 Tax=Rhizobium sp. R635 TaxID=1764275 RepID=UPI000B534140|nr:hypothetical protein [Rhizobium sp. R635]OWV84370.1 hypothetical protein ATY78_06625 [Rhizobium sp. R635]
MDVFFGAIAGPFQVVLRYDGTEVVTVSSLRSTNANGEPGRRSFKIEKTKRRKVIKIKTVMIDTTKARTTQMAEPGGKNQDRYGLSSHSTASLLGLIKDEKIADEDLKFDAHLHLFRRWQDGQDLDFLVGFLISPTTEERLRGAYYLSESMPKSEVVRDAAIELADDPLGYCRRIFIEYVLSSKLYDDVVAVRLANSLYDFDIHVRIETIYWAASTHDQRFDHFSKLVLSGAGARKPEPWRAFDLKRGARGLEIARRIRDGEVIEKIAEDMPGEDSFTFDYLKNFEGRLSRYREKRKARPLH